MHIIDDDYDDVSFVGGSFAGCAVSAEPTVSPDRSAIHNEKQRVARIQKKQQKEKEERLAAEQRVAAEKVRAELKAEQLEKVLAWAATTGGTVEGEVTVDALLEWTGWSRYRLIGDLALANVPFEWRQHNGVLTLMYKRIDIITWQFINKYY
jgi:hypothetical protein